MMILVAVVFLYGTILSVSGPQFTMKTNCGDTVTVNTAAVAKTRRIGLPIAVGSNVAVWTDSFKANSAVEAGGIIRAKSVLPPCGTR